jgi:hypothetical protein
VHREGRRPRRTQVARSGAPFPIALRCQWRKGRSLIGDGERGGDSVAISGCQLISDPSEPEREAEEAEGRREEKRGSWLEKEPI